MIGRNKSVGPDGIPGAILKVVWEVTIPYWRDCLTLPRDWKKPYWFLHASQIDLRGMQINGTRYSMLYTTSVGRYGLVIRRTTWLQNGIHVRE